MTTDLSAKMRATGNPSLIEYAKQYDEATEKLNKTDYTDKDLREWLKAWAFARGAWCAYSGEPF